MRVVRVAVALLLLALPGLFLGAFMPLGLATMVRIREPSGAARLLVPHFR
jgi:hypothetical protein